MELNEFNIIELIKDKNKLKNFILLYPINCSVLDGWKLIHFNSVYGNLENTKILISMGAEVNCFTPENMSPLFLACTSDKIDICKYLLENKADLTVKRNNEETCLLRAIFNDNIELVKLLLNYGSEISNKDLASALEFKKYSIFRLLCKEIKTKIVSLNTINNHTLLHLACSPSYRDKETILFLIKEGIDIHKYNKNGLTAVEIYTGFQLYGTGKKFQLSHKNNNIDLEIIEKFRLDIRMIFKLELEFYFKLRENYLLDANNINKVYTSSMSNEKKIIFYQDFVDYNKEYILPKDIFNSLDIDNQYKFAQIFCILQR